MFRPLRPVLALALLASACASPDDDVVTVDPDSSERAEELSNAASFSTREGEASRETPDGLALTVAEEYFERVQFGDWVAPDECSFNSGVRVALGHDGLWMDSKRFDGPISPEDDSVTGWLGGVQPLGSMPLSADVVPVESYASTTTSIVGGGWEVAGDGNSAVRVEPSPTTTPVVDTSVVPPDPSEPLEHLHALVVLVFTQKQVATLRFADPGLRFEARGRELSTVDTQPVDGWVALSLLVPSAAFHVDDIPALELELLDSDGASVTHDVELTETLLALNMLTPEWVFDESKVGDQCIPPVPDADADNEPGEIPTDILASPIVDPPPLPAVGELPADPTAATWSALDAIRRVYNMDDPLDEAKAQYAEDPVVALELIESLRDNAVLEPYLDQLDPVFGGLVFTSPSTASVLYRVGPSYQWEIGRVLLVDGTWRVADGTICRDLAAASYTCPGGIVADPPPGPLTGS